MFKLWVNNVVKIIPNRLTSGYVVTTKVVYNICCHIPRI